MDVLQCFLCCLFFVVGLPLVCLFLSFGCCCCCIFFYANFLHGLTRDESVKQLVLKKEGTSNSNQKNKTNTQAGNTQHTGTWENIKAQSISISPNSRNTISSSRSLSEAFLPMSLSFHLDAGESAVRCANCITQNL